MSHLSQELDSQLDALAKHGIGRDKIFSEKISTRIKVRPQFEDALKTAREIKAHAPHCRVIFTGVRDEEAGAGRGRIRESTLEGLETAARKGKYGGWPLVITDDMLHTVLRRKALGESVEQIQPDLNPHRQAHGTEPVCRQHLPSARRVREDPGVPTAHADFAALQQCDRSPVQLLRAIRHLA